MDQGQLRAAEAAEIRRAELSLTQKQTGVDPKTWRQFINCEQWPETLARGRIEAHLNLKLGALLRISQGRSGLDQEKLSSEPGSEFVPPQLEQMLALLNEAVSHYRSEQASLGDLKVGMVRDLADRILQEPPEIQADTP